MGNAWNGEVVLARVFDDALTGDQIALLYQDAAFAGQTPVEFALSNLTYLTRCEIGAGYTYTVYGNGFAAGDKVKFTSSANVTAAFTADAAFTEASGDNTLQSLAVTLPAGIPAGTGRYFMALVRNGSQYPLGTVEFTVCDNPSVSMPRIIAHRGQHQDGVENSTENSIAALTNAQKLGIHGAEFDVWITADDVPVINHNATVAGSDLRIEESAYAQIRDLTLANGEKLPTLDAYLEQGAKDASMKLICEIKTHSSAASNTRAVNAVVAAVKAKSMETRVDYIAFDYEVCKQLRAAMPAAGVQYLGGDKAPAEVAADKLSGIDYQYSTVLSKKPEWVTEAHAGGIEVNAWTVNSTADMMACIALGVDYITTDNPVTLKNCWRHRSSQPRKNRGGPYLGDTEPQARTIVRPAFFAESAFFISFIPDLPFVSINLIRQPCNEETFGIGMGRRCVAVRRHAPGGKHSPLDPEFLAAADGRKRQNPSVPVFRSARRLAR